MTWIPEAQPQPDLAFRDEERSWPTTQSLRCKDCACYPRMQRIGKPGHFEFRVYCVSCRSGNITHWHKSWEEALRVWNLTQKLAEL